MTDGTWHLTLSLREFDNLAIRPGPEERILAIMRQPEDLRPADTTSTVRLGDLYPVGHGL
jgi:hypothetical protein